MHRRGAARRPGDDRTGAPSRSRCTSPTATRPPTTTSSRPRPRRRAGSSRSAASTRGADPVAEIRRCVAAGARGMKLHPRAEQFDLDEPGVREIVAEAHAGRLPILIHAGRGIPALGAHVLELAAEFPRAQFILAHAGVCDLAWLWRRVDELPERLLRHGVVQRARTCWCCSRTSRPGGSSTRPTSRSARRCTASLLTFRCALQAGLYAEQIASVASGQLERLVAGEEALDVGPAPGPAACAPTRCSTASTYFLTSAIATGARGRRHGRSTSTSRASRASSETTRRRRRSAARSSRCSSCITASRRGRRCPSASGASTCSSIALVLASTPDVPVA